MFDDRDSLDSIGETFIYTDLLSSILRIIVFYDAIQFRNQALANAEISQKEAEKRFELLTERVEHLEKKVDELIYYCSLK